MKKISIALLCMIMSFAAIAQKDSEFWFAAPEVSQNGSAWLDRNIVVRITTYGEPAYVEISQPASGGMPTQTGTISANSAQTFDLTTWIASLENTPANATHNYGIRITATHPVTGVPVKIGAYYEVITGANGLAVPNNPETFILKGKNALGTYFYIPSQNLVANAAGYSPTPYNSFDIVATEDNTIVQITPSKNIVGHAAGTTFPVTLQRGQTYSATATSQAANQHLDGSVVTSDKPIAITVKDDLLLGSFFTGGCADLAGDQIVPVNHIGTRYIAIKGLLSTPGDYLFVTATQNSTAIYKDGSATPLSTITTAGQTYGFPIGSGTSTFVTTSKPAYMWQLSGSGCELGATILPRIDCSGSDSITYIRSSNNQFYINLLVPTGGQTFFQLNGVAPGYSMSFSPVPGTGGTWQAARVDLTAYTFQGSVISVSNTAAKFHMSVIDINGGGTSYAYLSDYTSVSAVAYATPNPVCIGGNINLSVQSAGATSYSWTGPNGFTSTLQNPVITNASSLNAGIYKVVVSNGQGCTDSAAVSVSLKECADSCNIKAGYCLDFDDPLTLNFWATGTPAGGSYDWDFGDGSSTSSPSGTASHTYAGPGYYTITITYSTRTTKCYKKYNVCIPENEKGKEQKAGQNSSGNSDLIGALYPNPANDAINVVIHRQDKSLSEAQVTLYSIEGSSVYSKKHSIPDSGILNIPISHLADGSYLCEINVGGQKSVKKFVKL